ncbi:MAG: hypothetical protein QG623_387 [Patescibacteria group bacterium]|nr:hypothetical protein [Patescibacteria group bacterium]
MIDSINKISQLAYIIVFIGFLIVTFDVTYRTLSKNNKSSRTKKIEKMILVVLIFLLALKKFI